MTAYRLGLTGKAVEWAVRTQKRRRTVSKTARKALKEVAWRRASKKVTKKFTKFPKGVAKL
jgi:hypothetical protein